MFSGPGFVPLTHIPFLCHLEVCHVPIREHEGGALTRCVSVQSAEGPQEDVWGEDACEDDRRHPDGPAAAHAALHPLLQLPAQRGRLDPAEDRRGPRLQGVCQSEEPRLSQAPAPQGAICRQLVCDRTCTEGQQGRGLSCTGGGLALTSGCDWGHGGGLGGGPALTWKLQSTVQVQVVFLQYRFKIPRLIFRPRRTGRSQVRYSV